MSSISQWGLKDGFEGATTILRIYLKISRFQTSEICLNTCRFWQNLQKISEVSFKALSGVYSTKNDRLIPRDGRGSVLPPDPGMNGRPEAVKRHFSPYLSLLHPWREANRGKKMQKVTHRQNSNHFENTKGQYDMAITIEQTYFDPVPTGRYLARIAEISAEDGQFGPQLKFRFELTLDEEGVGPSLLGWTSRKFSPSSKLYKWTRAALGGSPIPRDYTFNSDDLIGRQVYIQLLEKTNANGSFNKITDLEHYQQPPLQQPQVPHRDQPAELPKWVA